MVLTLVYLCAREVVSDHGLSAAWLSCVPGELYRPLLDAAFARCRPLAVGELVQRWPERTLSVGGRRKRDHEPPNRLCVQALLLAVVRGLTDKRYGHTQRRICLNMSDLILRVSTQKKKKAHQQNDTSNCQTGERHNKDGCFMY